MTSWGVIFSKDGNFIISSYWCWWFIALLGVDDLFSIKYSSSSKWISISASYVLWLFYCSFVSFLFLSMPLILKACLYVLIAFISLILGLTDSSSSSIGSISVSLLNTISPFSLSRSSFFWRYLSLRSSIYCYWNFLRIDFFKIFPSFLFLIKTMSLLSFMYLPAFLKSPVL